VIKNTWYFTYHHNPKNEWSTPKGFAEELEKQNINLIRNEVSNPKNMELPSANQIEKENIKVVLVFYAGYNEKLNDNLINFKKNHPKVILINELGDEPQTRNLNYVRAAISDISLTPDYECYKYWKDKGFNCYWFNHWADSKLFYRKNKGKRKYFIGTSMGNRKYSFILKLLLGRFFINRRLNDLENTDFYNNSEISFQYARWSEITRRIFESGACGCCIITNKIPKGKMLEKIFTHNESIILYTNIFSLIKQLFLILKDKKKIKRISENSYYIIKRNHTVDKRVDTLIKLVNKFNTEDKASICQ
tara:strand:+ start:83 stop:997 length:915 start_codon:yes stop_codon:yes gene_type:complete